MVKTHTTSPRLNELVQKCIPEPILKMDTSAGSNPGDNLIGKMVSVHVTTESGKEEDLITKALVPFGIGEEPINDSDKRFAKLLTMFHIFTTELGYYQRIKPGLDNLFPGYALPIPRYYFGDDDAANNGLEACLVLEDVRPKGYKMPDKMVGLTREEVFLILEKIAKFHAASALYLQKTNVFGTNRPFDILTKHIFQKSGGPAVQKVHTLFLWEVYADMVRSAEETGYIPASLAKKVLEYASDPRELVIEDFKNARDEYFPVVIHGDLWTNNVLVKYDDNGKPVDLLFIDFQQCRYASVFDELHYFLYTSTTLPFRQEHLKTCLDFYHDTFIETFNTLVGLNKVDMDGEAFLKKFTKEAFLKGYHKYLGSAFAYGVFAIPFQIGITPADYTNPVKETDNNNKDSSGATLSEMESLELFFAETYKNLTLRLKAAGKNSPQALERCKELCLEMDALGIFDK